jgi:hypothetical protein
MVKLKRIFSESPVLEKRMRAVAEISWVSYLCGDALIKSQVDEGGFLVEVTKLGRHMLTQPVSSALQQV